MTSPWLGKRVLITSGPTREYLDPIRYLTNASSGRMGFALAAAAARRGARVTVVSGPSTERAPRGVRVVPVVTGLEMYREALRLCRGADVVVGAAAVSDWRFASMKRHKIKRAASPLSLTLTPNPDIIKEVARKRPNPAQMVVGFALETRRTLASAREKLRSKGLDLVVANGPSSLSGDRTRIAIVWPGGGSAMSPPLPKREAARRILEAIESLWAKKS